MAAEEMPYGLSWQVNLPYPLAVAHTREALRLEGLGPVSEVDVSGLIREQMDVDSRPYVILGAGDAPLLCHLLEAEPRLGLLLPCNVVVYELDGASMVAAVDTMAILGLARNPELAPLAAELKARLERVVERVVATAGEGEDIVLPVPRASCR